MSMTSRPHGRRRFVVWMAAPTAFLGLLLTYVYYNRAQLPVSGVAVAGMVTLPIDQATGRFRVTDQSWTRIVQPPNPAGSERLVLVLDNVGDEDVLINGSDDSPDDVAVLHAGSSMVHGLDAGWLAFKSVRGTVVISVEFHRK